MATKYFFGYHTFSGRVFPVAWIENEGKAIGGEPQNVIFQKELPEEVWSLSLHTLSEMYPLPDVAPTTPPPP